MRVSGGWSGICVATSSIWIHEHKRGAISLPVVNAIVPDEHPSMVVLQVASIVKIRSIRLVVGSFLSYVGRERQRWIYMFPRRDIDDVVSTLNVSAVK